MQQISNVKAARAILKAKEVKFYVPYGHGRWLRVDKREVAHLALHYPKEIRADDLTEVVYVKWDDF